MRKILIPLLILAALLVAPLLASNDGVEIQVRNLSTGAEVRVVNVVGAPTYVLQPGACIIEPGPAEILCANWTCVEDWLADNIRSQPNKEGYSTQKGPCGGLGPSFHWPTWPALRDYLRTAVQ